MVVERVELAIDRVAVAVGVDASELEDKAGGGGATGAAGET